ncbi:C2H2-like zinc finger protein [Forsythia ovata]|uniref:C2H2-like zinc finger protein n=1 Tax=Forsythia ovata TaxID=205694 RepID=A0ABD1QSI7_9LAMI
MEEDQGMKHMCKFCSKSFPSGRSLGGHMRSHLINISSDEKLIRKKKLPPLTNAKSSNSEIVYELRENPKKTNKSSKESNIDDVNLFESKICKECGKSFQSWKALFGHMKCHSVNIGKNITSVDEDSWNGSNDDLKPDMDSESDNEGLNPCRRKRSDRMIKRYNTSSCLSTISEIDQQEQEEVAISLIMLSRDVMNSVLDQSSENNSKFLESEKISKKFNLENGSEVNSPKKLIKKKTELSDFQEKVTYFGTSDYEFEKKRKFECTHCHKAFSSYQALGGHRASHKKFKGCCTPNTETTREIDIFAIKAESQVSFKNISKDHQCPICFKVFASGQALGGHKRSHLIRDAKNNPSIVIEKREPIRGLLDLNLPAPVEQDLSNEQLGLNPWWSGTTSLEHDLLLGLLSS